MCADYYIKIVMLLLGLDCQFKIDGSQTSLAAFHVASHIVLIFGVDSTLREINLKCEVDFSTGFFSKQFSLR